MSLGNTLEFLLSPARDAETATRFFCKVLHSPTASVPQAIGSELQTTESCKQGTHQASPAAPRVINVDKNAAYPKAIADLKISGILPDHVELRQVKYLNNLIEQDHRFIKRLRHPWDGLLLL